MRPLVICLLLTACGGTTVDKASAFHTDADTDGTTPTDAPVDSDVVNPSADDDNDGYTADVDCDDDNASVHPGATEVCNGIDDDCVGGVDGSTSAFEGGTGPVAPDNDGDGYGLQGVTRWYCTVPTDWVTEPGDCNDNDATRSPAAPELCDGIDNDCDGLTDDDDDMIDPTGTVGAIQGWIDGDGDGFGAGAPRWFCTHPSGVFVDTGGDCDDTTSNRSPVAIESCNGIDDDCDGATDAEDDGIDPSFVSPHFADVDGDNHGDPAVTRLECTLSPNAGWVPDGDDCDDLDANNFPGNPEVCDDVDNNCDDDIDEDDATIDPALLTTGWRDADGDSYGDPGVERTACVLPPSYVDNSDDCADASWVNGVPPGSIHPGATEVCNDLDDDCDDDIDDEDDDLVTTNAWYADSDGDGFGDAASVTASCIQPTLTSANASDCDDSHNATFPGAAQADSTTDCMRDDDDDGFGDAHTSGAVMPGTDCDDTEVYAFVGAAERDSLTLCQADVDGDGFGDATPAPGVTPGTDCNDGEAEVHPDADEIWYDDVDQDCSGSSDHDQDGDGDDTLAAGGTDCDDEDAARAGTLPDLPYDGIDQDCSGADLCDVDADGFNARACPGGTDCDDDVFEVNTSATEICNDVDDNCNDLADEGLATQPWWLDDDDDGFGVLGDPTEDCHAPGPNWAPQTGDCDDDRFDTNPDGIEVCNGLDDNCDSAVDEGYPSYIWYVDSDGDGWGTWTAPLLTCLPMPATGYADKLGDCAPNTSAVHPLASETCDGADNDCNGIVDDGFTLQTFYVDADGDGHGDLMLPVLACAAPSGTVSASDDCDDSDDEVKPGGTETCDGVDEDCNGVIDDGPSLTTIAYAADRDGDGFGSDTDLIMACRRPPGALFVGGDVDCNDSDPTIHPGADDAACDDVDSDCAPDIPAYIIPDEASGVNHVQNLANNAGQTEVAVCYQPGTYGGAADPASIPSIVEIVGLGAEPDDVLLYHQPNGRLSNVHGAKFRNLRIAAHPNASIAPSAVFDNVHVTWPQATQTAAACSSLLTSEWLIAKNGSVFERLHITCQGSPKLFGANSHLSDTTFRDIQISTTDDTLFYYGLFGGQSTNSLVDVHRVNVEDLQLTHAGRARGALFHATQRGVIEDLTVSNVRLDFANGVYAGLVEMSSSTDLSLRRMRVRDLTVQTGGSLMSGAVLRLNQISGGSTCFCERTRTLANIDVAGVYLEGPTISGGLFSVDGGNTSNRLRLAIQHATIVGVHAVANQIEGILGRSSGSNRFEIQDSIVAHTSPVSQASVFHLATFENTAGFHTPADRYASTLDPLFNDVRITETDGVLSFDDPTSWDLQLSATSPYLDALLSQSDVDGSAADLGAYGGDGTGPVDGPWFAWP